MLPGFATMLRLPRTAAQRRRPSAQPPPSDMAAGPPTEGLTSHPLPEKARKNMLLQRAVEEPQEGHARDIIQLWHAQWFGPLSRSKAPLALGELVDDTSSCGSGSLLPPPRSRRPHADGPQEDSESAESPSTASQQSMSSALPQPSLAQPILLSRQQQAQAAAIQDLPGIGTWAGRYRLFGRQLPAEPEEQQPQPGAGPGSEDGGRDAEQETVVFGGLPHLPDNDEVGSPVVLRPGGFGPPAAYGSEQAQEDAWRWRFSRKWATEQKKYYDAQPTQSVVSDDLEALHYTQACGIGVNLQVMPTSRPRQAPSPLPDDSQLLMQNSGSTLSMCQFDVEQSYVSQGPLSAEQSPGCSTHGARAVAPLLRAGSGNRQLLHTLSQGMRSPMLPSATKSVLKLASKGQDLLKKQGDIEAEVQDRWERSCAASDAWAGRNLPAVKVDMHGRFKYCVLRVSDGTGHTRFIVRGRYGSTPDSLLEGAVEEAASASRAGGLPAVIVEVVGSGYMEWREDTERELHLTPSLLPADGQQRRSDSPTKSAYLSDVTGLTASLMRQALPCHFRITTRDAASRSASLAAGLTNRI